MTMAVTYTITHSIENQHEDMVSCGLISMEGQDQTLVNRQSLYTRNHCHQQVPQKD